jgi:Amidase
MDRRDFMELMLLTGGSAMTAGATTARFDVSEKTVAELQAAMQSGKTTAQQLVRLYLERIAAIDKAGPRLNSVIELNPDAMSIAAALDTERKTKGPRGPLHGIPVLLKDNIATADKMQTTAGSLALVNVKPPRDAFLVDRLRQAGVVILGKTNLSEWANMRSTRSTSGWSARGGLTLNPYALDRNTPAWQPAWRQWRLAPKPMAPSPHRQQWPVWLASNRPWDWSADPASCRSPIRKTPPAPWHAAWPMRPYCSRPWRAATHTIPLATWPT